MDGFCLDDWPPFAGITRGRFGGSDLSQAARAAQHPIASSEFRSVAAATQAGASPVPFCRHCEQSEAIHTVVRAAPAVDCFVAKPVLGRAFGATRGSSK